MEPVTLYSKTGTTATVTTPSVMRELQAAGWTLTPQAPAETLPAADAPVVTEGTPVKKPGRPKKAE